jgi:cytochrome c-type biogenesis protein
MELLIAAFLAGLFTILAPCVVSIIPILLARSADGKRGRSPFFVIVGLSVSIIIFTVLLKATSLLLGVPSDVWKVISGGIVIAFGLFTLFPALWKWIVLKTRLIFKAQNTMGDAAKKRGVLGDVLLGASLGPVFSACSPTYALIVATVLPASPLQGLGYLLVFVAGLALMLSLIATFGQALIKKLGWGINPRGAFRRVLGVILIAIGIMIVTGLDKTLLGYLVESGWYDFQINLESLLM